MIHIRIRVLEEVIPHLMNPSPALTSRINRRLPLVVLGSSFPMRSMMNIPRRKGSLRPLHLSLSPMSLVTSWVVEDVVWLQVLHLGLVLVQMVTVTMKRTSLPNIRRYTKGPASSREIGCNT